MVENSNENKLNSDWDIKFKEKDNYEYYKIMTEILTNNPLLLKGISTGFLGLLYDNYLSFKSDCDFKSNVIIENGNYFFCGYYDSSIIKIFTFNNLICLANNEFCLNFKQLEGFSVFKNNLKRKKLMKILNF